MNSNIINQSNLISRDLSWLNFNYRVLDQVKDKNRGVLDKLKFLSIVSSNFDEFFEIRVGSLYNYIDNNKKRIDYSGMREEPFREFLLEQCSKFFNDFNTYFSDTIITELNEKKIFIGNLDNLDEEGQKRAKKYFKKTIFPMLTPMVFDNLHSFPILMNKVLIFGVVTKTKDSSKKKKISFIQIPVNLPRFFEYKIDDNIFFIPIEKIISKYIDKFFRSVLIESVSLFRIIRNGDFTLEESEDIETNFLEELKQKLKDRKFSRVVRIEISKSFDDYLLKSLKERFKVDDLNIMRLKSNTILDYTSLNQIIDYNEFSELLPNYPSPIKSIDMEGDNEKSIFEILSDRDVFLHHPYNSFDPVIKLLNEAADDPNVLSIKITLYRTAKNSGVIDALLKAAEKGKHVSVLFEVKARFDEENNLRNGYKLEKAGCYVIYGIGSLKTHTKLLLIVRREGKKVKNYAHMGTGNYNETTSRLYTDLSLMTSNQKYTKDALEFFNVITGHSVPDDYENLITAPIYMRDKIISLIQGEIDTSLSGGEGKICIKINSLQDKDVINKLYEASNSGVKVCLIVRGICCLRPGREGLSENIKVLSVVGDYLEHSRLYYFHNGGNPIIYSGSADVMIRSFKRRIESLFKINEEFIKKEAITILNYNLRDNCNSYELNEDGSYSKREKGKNKEFNLFKEFYLLDRNKVEESIIL
ncbi:MAG: polyphosphate kinase 1 [Bacteroidota bacterium]|jgi:polyphosphate kinase|nr:polyphosphate kinase 1 [Bacteroidota bacterium]|tara:strand:+ start:4690 stop:6783 length:2094 start_codon:yes stop_codon:yes gene_type:complete